MRVLTVYAHPNPKVAAADGLAFIAPVFRLHFPAILKGWFERVFAYGSAYELTMEGWHGHCSGRVPLMHHENTWAALTPSGATSPAQRSRRPPTQMRWGRWRRARSDEEATMPVEAFPTVPPEQLRKRSVSNLLRMGHCAPTVMQTMLDASDTEGKWLVLLMAGLPDGIANARGECGGLTAPLVQIGLRHDRLMMISPSTRAMSMINCLSPGQAGIRPRREKTRG